MTLPNGYTLESTFWEDFSIADRFGLDAVKDTYKRCFSEWKDDCKMLTELVIVLNYKLWQHYEGKHDAYAELYNDLWAEADNYAMDNLQDEELQYFLRITD